MHRPTTVAVILLVLGVSVGTAQNLTPTAELAKRGLGPDDFPRITELAENVYAYEDVHLQGEITTNSLFVVTEDGVLVADGQGRTDQVERMLAEIGQITDQPVRYVVTGSNHGDHTGGNGAFPPRATFVVHPTAQAALDRAEAPVTLSTEVVSDRLELNMGGTQIQILHLGRAHTGSDLVVYLPVEKVLFMSESYLHRMFPSLGGGYPTEWIEAIRRAEEMDVDIYVPGHGFVDDAATLNAELGVFRQALETVIAEGTRLHSAGTSAEDAASQANLGAFADWSIGEIMAPRAIARVYAELNGELN
jgi:cyclase